MYIEKLLIQISQLLTQLKIPYLINGVNTTISKHLILLNNDIKTHCFLYG